MRMYLLSLLASAMLIVVSGCAQQGMESSWVEPRPLGRDFSTLRPPERPSPTTARVAEVPDPEGVLTLRRALATALMRNPALAAFSWEVRSAEARQLQAGLWPNPEIGVEVEEVGRSSERGGFDSAQTTIQLSQLIELAGKRRKRTTLASLERQLAGWDYETKRLDVLTDVAKAFIEVLGTQRRVKLIDELVQLSERLVNTVGQRVDAGKDSPVEKTKAEVVLAKVKIQRQQAQRSLESARRQLAAGWASKEVTFQDVTGDIEAIQSIPEIAALQEFLVQNPDVARWTLEIEKRQATLELERAKAVQDITINGGIQRFNETDDSAVILGLSIPLPVSDRNQGNILAATYDLAKGRAERRAWETRVYATLSKAYEDLSYAFTQATETKDKVLSGAKKAFDAAEEAYREGKADYLVVLDAQRTLFEVKAQYIDALVSYQKARTDMERLIGQPLDTVENSEQ